MSNRFYFNEAHGLVFPAILGGRSLIVLGALSSTDADYQGPPLG
jgi:hypothetical protein